MMEFCPYITFEDSCGKALQFYKHCFGGEIVFIQYYDSNGHNPDAKGKVMHSEFRSGNIHLMACDKSPEQKLHQGTNITMYISLDSETEQRKIFTKLSENGVVHMPLEPTVWGSRLGVLTDQFGVHWMLVVNN